MRDRTLRKDRDYNSLGSAISSLKAKELVDYIFIIEKVNRTWCRLFDPYDWQCFMVKFKELAIKLEVERKMRYGDFKKKIGKYIENISYEEFKNEMIVLVRETYVSKEENELFKKAKTIFKKDKINVF